MKGREKNRKRNLRLAVLLAALTLLGGCGSGKLSEKFDEDTVKAESQKAIGYFNERDYQSLLDMGSQELKDSITVEELQQACDPYLDKCGQFQEIKKEVVMGSTDKETGAEYGGVVAVGQYEDGKIQFTVGFDEEMEMVQFLIK